MRSARIDESPTRRKRRCDRTERRAKALVEASSRVVIDRLGRLDGRPDSPPSEPAPTFHNKVGFLIVVTPYRQTATWGSRGIFNQ
jgi:hypothetical protein